MAGDLTGPPSHPRALSRLLTAKAVRLQRTAPSTWARRTRRYHRSPPEAPVNLVMPADTPLSATAQAIADDGIIVISCPTTGQSATRALAGLHSYRLANSVR